MLVERTPRLETCLLLLLQRDLPYQLDSDLKTMGTTTLSNAIDTDKQFFGAHYRTVTDSDGSRRLVGFNFTEEAQGGVVHFWEFDDKFNRLSKAQVKLPVRGRCMLQHLTITTATPFITRSASCNRYSQQS